MHESYPDGAQANLVIGAVMDHVFCTSSREIACSHAHPALSEWQLSTTFSPLVQRMDGFSAFAEAKAMRLQVMGFKQ